MDSAEQTGGKREGKISLMFHQFSFIPFNPYLSLSLCLHFLSPAIVEILNPTGGRRNSIDRELIDDVLSRILSFSLLFSVIEAWLIILHPFSFSLYCLLPHCTPEREPTC